ncbi:DMT family transporter [Puniceibacterium sediminis]|uniref:EamA-like transporter family protein n=1 Tax=Puniceibacterium sediminis TaxID=1608407 RepID=A0A238ZLY4_9RHOB|nr:DMT family transporter [Puniceibacterium sediminis]SNR84377.1 EamA-like transporter family protein [Puniceibacterium sediminis]
MQLNQTLMAAGLALAASAILSFIDNFVTAVSQEAGLWQFQVFRTLFAVPLLLVAGRVSGRVIRPVNLPRLAARSLAVSVGLLIYFASLGTLPVSQAGAGLFSAPLWVALLSVVLFRQGIGALGAFAVMLGFAGALMLLQPDLHNLTGLSLMPLAAGMFYGFGMMLTRHWCTQESAITLALGIFVTIGAAGLIMLCVMTHWPGDAFISAPWTAPSTRFLWLTLLQAVGSVCAVTLIAQAYRIGNPSLVAVFEYSFLIFASLWAFLLWGTATNALAWVGMAVILASGIMMATSQKEKANATVAL